MPRCELVHAERLREVLSTQGGLLVFLEAGLSFGGVRLTGRMRFDYDRYDDRPRSWPDEPRLSHQDDGLPLPSWPWLAGRMHEMRIHVALGILVSSQNIGTDTARERLRGAAQRAGVSEAELAEALIAGTVQGDGLIDQ